MQIDHDPLRRRRAAVVRRDGKAFCVGCVQDQRVARVAPGFLLGIEGRRRGGVAGAVDQDIVRARAVPGLGGPVGQQGQGRDRHGTAQGFGLWGPREGGLVEGALTWIVGGDRPGHQHELKRHQSRVSDHQKEGQGQNGRDIVRVQPASLALAEPQKEEVGEDFLVGDHPRQDGQKHPGGGDADEIAGPEDRHIVKVEMETVQEVAAPRVAHGDLASAGRIQDDFGRIASACAGRAPGYGHALASPQAGQGHRPRRGPGGPFSQQTIRRFERLAGGCGGLGQFGPHPVIDLVLEEGGRAEQEDGEHEPARQQARPAVQQRHGLAKARLHPWFLDVEEGREQASAIIPLRTCPPSMTTAGRGAFRSTAPTTGRAATG